MSDFAAIYPAGTAAVVAGEVLIKLFLKCNYTYRYSFASMLNGARLVAGFYEREAGANKTLRANACPRSEQKALIVELKVIATK